MSRADHCQMSKGSWKIA
jgi:hypothetical protein